MIVEAHEVRQRFAARVAELDGYEEADAPFDPSSAPSSQARPFAVQVPQTLSNGTRDRSGGAMDVRSRVLVRVHAPVYQAGPSRVSRVDDEMQAEAQLVRHLMVQGQGWALALRVDYAGTDRRLLPGDEWLETDHTFDVGHQVQL